MSKGPIEYLSAFHDRSIRAACNGNLSLFYRENRHLLGMSRNTFFAVMTGKGALGQNIEQIERLCTLMHIDTRYQDEIDVLDAFWARIMETTDAKLKLYYLERKPEIDACWRSVKYRHTYLTQDDIYGPERPRHDDGKPIRPKMQFDKPEFTSPLDEVPDTSNEIFE